MGSRPSNPEEIKLTMPISQIRNLKIHYQIRGLGEPLLLIMGYRGSGYMWGEELLAPLSRYFRVITFDNCYGSLQDNEMLTMQELPFG